MQTERWESVYNVISCYFTAKYTWWLETFYFHFKVYSHSILSWEMWENKQRERTGKSIKDSHIIGMKGAREEKLQNVLCVCSRLKY